MKCRECWFLRGFAWLSIAFASLATAATPRPLPIPDIPLGRAGHIHAIARLPDGSLVLGGKFTLIDGVPRRNLARLRPDGTLDMDWNPSLDGVVRALATDAFGNVFVGGNFQEIDGLPRRNLAKLSGSGRGAVDSAWDPGANLNTPRGIDALAVNQRGDVFAAGEISPDNTSTRLVVKLSGNGAGTMDANWNPPLERAVTALAADARGAIYIASYGSYGAPRTALQKFSDSGPGAEIADWRQSLEGLPQALALGADGTLYVGYAGGFSLEDGKQHYLARFPPDSHGEIDRAWDPPYSQSVSALTVDVSGTVYASLEGDSVNEPCVVKLARTPNGGVSTEWQVPAREVKALAVAVDGSLYVGGHFDRAWEAPPPRLSLARVSAVDGGSLSTVDALLPGTVNAIAFQPDGGMIVGGNFARVGATPRRNILRLGADGRLDSGWNPSLDFTSVLALAVDGNSSVYVGGNLLASQPVPIVRLRGSGAGAADPAWRPLLDANAVVQALALDGRGAIYVGGHFSTIAGVPRTNIAKLSVRDAAPDPRWNADMQHTVRAVVIGNDDAVHVASGDIGHDVSGLTIFEGEIAKLSGASGTTERGWIHPLPGAAFALAQAPDGSLYAGGHFYDTAEGSRYVMKFTRDGLPDANWNDMSVIYEDFRVASALALDSNNDIVVAGRLMFSGQGSFLSKVSGATGATIAGWDPTIDGDIATVVMAPDDHLYIGGSFTTINGQPRTSLAALPAQVAPPRPAHGRRPPPILVRPIRAQRP